MSVTVIRNDESTSLPDDLQRMGYPEGARDNLVYASIFFSPSTNQWYGIFEDRCFAVASDNKPIWNILTKDVPQCWCGALFFEEKDVFKHEGVHGGEYSSLDMQMSIYSTKKRVLSCEEIKANIQYVVDYATKDKTPIRYAHRYGVKGYSP